MQLGSERLDRHRAQLPWRSGSHVVGCWATHVLLTIVFFLGVVMHLGGHEGCGYFRLLILPVALLASAVAYGVLLRGPDWRWTLLPVGITGLGYLAGRLQAEDRARDAEFGLALLVALVAHCAVAVRIEWQMNLRGR